MSVTPAVNVDQVQRQRAMEREEQLALRERRVRRVQGLALFAALAPFLAAITIGAYALVQGRRDILVWTVVPWVVCALNGFAWWWAPRKLRVSRGIILWSVFGGLGLSILTFGMRLGGMSLFLAWTIVLGAMLYGPTMAVVMTALSALMVVLTMILQALGLVPWIAVDPAWEIWGNFFLSLIYPVAMLGSVYMYADYIQDTLAAAGQRIREHVHLVVESAQQQAAAAQQQAAAVQQISATAEELSRTAEQIAANSRQLDHVAERTYQQVEEDHRLIRNILDTVEHFTQEMHDLVEQAVRLNDHMQQVGEIVDLIGRISDETHLIALNAAIEAASAGEQGQRFAVIAAEIRRLAEHAITSGDQIKRIIRDVQQTGQSVVMSMESEVQRVQALEQQARTAGQRLEQMVEAVELTRTAARELADAATDLRSVSQQLAESLHEMSQGAESLATTSRQNLEVAQALEEIAETITTSGV